MDFRTGIGKGGVALAALVAIAMCILSFIFHPVYIDHVDYGICLPSPDSWDFSPFWSWMVNTFLIALITLMLWLINRSYNFIRTTEPTLVALFLIMTCAGPWFTQELSTSVILCMANVVCLGIIFDSYDSRNATQEMFTLGVVIGFGSMVQYAFLPMAPVYLIWALCMKVLRVKETLAFCAGILCPYWIGIGVGWIHFSDLHFPSITPLFTMQQNPAEFFILLSGIAIAVVGGMLVSIANFMKLFAGNSKVNAMNMCVMILGVACVICILVDFDNMAAYVVTLYMAAAVQFANICALWHPKMPWAVTTFPALAYLAIFVCSMIF